MTPVQPLRIAVNPDAGATRVVAQPGCTIHRWIRRASALVAE
jgi:hypothetical protein